MSRCLASGTLPRPLIRAKQRPVRALPVVVQPLCLKLSSKFKHQDSKPQQQHRPQQPPAALPRLLAGCSGAAVSLVAPLLPSYAAELLDDTYLDPTLAESPDVLGTLLIVVVTYFTVMVLYLWLTSFLDEDSKSGDSSSQSPDQSDVPPGYRSFLDAHVRSYVDPHHPEGGSGSHNIRALQALEEVMPLEGESLEQLKGRLAAGAAEALDQQIRDAERLVRTKLLARKLGYTHGTAKLDKPSSSSSSGAAGVSHRAGELTPAEISSMLTAVLYTPGGLNSCQYKQAIDALLDQEIEKQLPPGGGAYHDDLIVRAVMRRVVSALVMEESLLLLEGVDQARRVLEAAGKQGKEGHKKWAIW